MRILLLTHAFNGLTQRLLKELQHRQHVVSIEFDIADSVSEEACKLFQPQLIIAPFLKRAIPASIWQNYTCLIVHPGVVGDQGSSSLDYAILRQEPQWGVTVLQANAEMDGGDIWASVAYPTRITSKSSLYRRETTDAAVAAVLQAIAKFSHAEHPCPLALHPDKRGIKHVSVTQQQRQLDWQGDPTADILRKIHSADSTPGVLDTLFGQACYLYDAHPQGMDLLQQCLPDSLTAAAGSIIARRNQAILVRTIDGAIWITHARLKTPEVMSFKLPVAFCFPDDFVKLPELKPEALHASADWNDIRYREQDHIGYLSFEFYNGAMSTSQCQCLQQAIKEIKQHSIQVLVLLGGQDFFSNGIHLNVIEAHTTIPGQSAADESWRNIQAMDDLCLELINCADFLTVAALRGNSGAGGVFMALASDKVWAHNAVILNPHYKNMGNLYGSEYWTYLLPRRIGVEQSRSLMKNRQPMLAKEACDLHLIDAVFGDNLTEFSALLHQRACQLGRDSEALLRKQTQRKMDEALKPLQAYRDEELAQMHKNFYGFDPSYHVARHHFVYKTAHAWTPRHIARHRDIKPAKTTS